MIEIKKNIARPESALVERAACFSSATLHEAMGKRGSLSYGIKPIIPEIRVCGPAVTISSPPMDNLMLHKGIVAAQSGDILVVEVGGVYEAGYWGEIMTHAAQHRGIAGLVIDGCVRDGTLIQRMAFPVFARGLSIRGTKKEGVGAINQPLTIGEIIVNPGDLIVGDGDGVVVVPREEIAQVLREAQKREEKEEEVMKEITAGKTTLEIFGWT